MERTERFPGLDDFLTALRLSGIPIGPHDLVWVWLWQGVRPLGFVRRSYPVVARPPFLPRSQPFVPPPPSVSRPPPAEFLSPDAPQNDTAPAFLSGFPENVASAPLSFADPE